MNEIRYGLRLSASAATWGLHLYLRRFLSIVGLSMIPTIQRFWLVSQSDDISTPVVVASEVLTEGSRLLLVWLLLRFAVSADDLLGPLSLRERWNRFTRFIEAHGWAFATQFGVLAAAFAVFDALPNLLIATLVPAAEQQWITAIVVAVKNPTVIAWTFIWMIGVARLMMRTDAPTHEPSHPERSVY